MIFRFIPQPPRSNGAEPEAELQTPRDCYEAMVQGSRELTLVWGRDGVITFVSRAAKTMLGFDPSELVGRNSSDLVHPDDLASAQASVACEQEGECATGEWPQWRVRTASGGWKTVEASVSNLLDLPSIGGIVVNCRDITDRTAAERALGESERRLEWVFEASPSLTYVLRVEGDQFVPQFLSANFERLLGYSIAEGMDPRFWPAHIHVDDRVRVQEQIGRALESENENGCAYEYRVQRRNGTWVWVHDQCRVIRGEDGRPTHLVGACNDLTERKELEAKLLRIQRLESVGRLASGIAHDLNNILAPVTMAASLLGEAALTSRERDLLTTIETSSQRGAAIIRQLLAFGRGVEGDRVAVELGRIVRDMHKVIVETFPKNVRVDVASGPDVWMIRGDATQLHQVLMNLCINARDAMPAGGRLSIRLENAAVGEEMVRGVPNMEPGRYVLLRVADTGTGIPPEHLDRIFDPFFTTKPVGQGTGLGLSTTLGIVRAHGGFVTVESRAGEGTEFRVYLPAAEAPVGAAAAPARVAAPRGDGELVLVVDDEAAVRMLVDDVLQRNGYRVLTAANGAEGLELFARHQADIAVVVLDWLMPVLDGPSTIRGLRLRAPGVKIIAMSGLFSDPDQTPGSVQATLAKPYTPAALLQTVHAVIHAESR